MAQPKQEVLAEFDKCPVCGSENRLMKKLLDDEILAGRRDKDEQGQACLQMLTASVMDPLKPPIIGALIPAGTAVIDVCLQCGTIYAPIVVKSYVRNQPPPMPGMQGGIPPERIPGFGNPR